MIIRPNRICLSLILLSPSKTDLKVVNVQELASETTKSISMLWKTGFEDVTTHEKFLQLCLCSAVWMSWGCPSGRFVISCFSFICIVLLWLSWRLPLGWYCTPLHQHTQSEFLGWWTRREWAVLPGGEMSLPGAAQGLDLSRLLCLKQACREDREERESGKQGRSKEITQQRHGSAKSPENSPEN